MSDSDDNIYQTPSWDGVNYVDPNVAGALSYTTGNITLGTGSGNITLPNFVSTVGGGGGGGGGTYYTTTTGGTQWANITPSTAHFDSSLVINHKGQQINVGESLSMIMDRLCIIEPSLHLHAKYPALKEAYDAYKAIEAMCKAGDKEDE